MANTTHPHVSPVTRDHSRQLRQTMTTAEALLWAHVRNNQLGIKIRRQYPIGRFIVDFYCDAACLIIEIDGDVHAEPAQMETDAVRTEWLCAQGYDVIRFTNDDVLHRLDGVLLAIYESCASRSNRTR